MSSLINAYIAYQFLKLLTTSWENTNAYKLGLIDDKGTLLRSAKTTEEREAYSVFHRLVFNLKRILEKTPVVSSKIASYAAAIYLLKENVKSRGYDESVIEQEFCKQFNLTPVLLESYEDMTLPAGKYTIKSDSVPNAKVGDKIIINNDITAFDNILGIPVFRIVAGGKTIIVTKDDLK